MKYQIKSIKLSMNLKNKAKSAIIQQILEMEDDKG